MTTRISCDHGAAGRPPLGETIGEDFVRIAAAHGDREAVVDPASVRSMYQHRSGGLGVFVALRWARGPVGRLRFRTSCLTARAGRGLGKDGLAAPRISDGGRNDRDW
jgi:hypothetical protein